MIQTMVSKVNYFLLGLGIGSVVGILFAPKSGEETREYLAQKTREGSQYVQEKAREVREGAEGIAQRSKEVIAQTEEQIATAIDAGREAYQREKPKGARRVNGEMT